MRWTGRFHRRYSGVKSFAKKTDRRFACFSRNLNEFVTGPSKSSTGAFRDCSCGFRLTDRMKKAFALALLLLSACATTSPFPIGGTGPVRSDSAALLGQSTRVGALVATPMRVIEDSRCPINARCVWAGRVVLETRIDGAGWRETANLELGKDYRTHGTGLALVAVEPGKMAGETALPAPYTFTFETR